MIMAIKTYQDSKDKYLKEKVDTFVLRVPKGKKDEIMEYAKAKGMSLNGYITDLIFADMGQPIEKAAPAKPKAKKEASAKPKATKVQEKAVEKPQEKPVEKPQEPAPEPKKKAMPSFLL